MAHEHSQQQRQAAASALYKRDEDDFENVKPTWRGLFSFTERSHIVFLGGGIFVAIASGLIIPCQSLLFGYIFKAFADLGAGAITGEKALATVSEYCIYMACLGSVSWLLQTSFFSIWMVFGDLTARACYVKVFRSLIRKELSWYDKLNEGISALLPRVQTTVQELRESISYPLGSAVKNFATAIGALAVAFWFCWQLTLVVVSSLPVSAIVVGFLSAKMDLNIQLQAQEMQKAMKCVTNALGSIEVVKCFNGQNSEVWRASTKFREAGKYYTIQAAMSALGVGFTQMATLGMFVQGFWYGSVLVAKGEKDAGQVLTTFWATLVATQALQGLLSQLLVFEKGRIAGTKLGALAYDHRSASSNEASGGKRPTDCQGAITFRNVSFSYPSRPTQLVLHKVCMSFAAGETTFIIGKSGSGKSTIGQLLLRLYRPLSGEICLDDEAISSIDTRWLRENVTVVEQTSTLFNESIFRNIALGKKDPDSVALSSVKMAADFALLTQAIEDLPKGVWSAVGSRGKSLSGGQKQRVAIARAKLRDTPILLLDESTSALDASSRMQLLQNIRRWRQGKTTIIITHEIAHILPQDYVYILEQGKVVQNGYRYSMQHDKEGVFHNYISQRTRMVERDADDSPTFYHNGAPSISGDYIGSFGIDGTDNDISFLQEHVNSPTVSSRYSQDAHVPATFRDHDKSDDEPSQSDSDQLLSPTLKKDISSAGKRFYKLPFVTSPLLQTISTRSPDGRGANFERLGYKHMRSSMSALSPLSPVPLMFPRRERIRRSHLDAVPGSPGTAFSRDMLSLRSEENEGFLYLKGADVTSQKSVKHRFSAEQLALPAQPMKVTVLLKTVWPVLGLAARFWLILGFISAVTHAAATPAFSYIFSELLSTLYLKEKRHRTLGFTLSILVIAAIDGVASFLSRYLFEYCAEKWVAATRVEALRRLLQQPREFFDEDMNSVARIAEGLDNHAEQMRSILSRFAGLGFIALVMLTFAIVWSFVTCWKVTAVVLATAPIMYAVATCYGAISSKWDALCAEADEVIGVVMTETFTNLRTIRTLALEDSFQKKLSEATAESFRTGFKRSLYIGIFYGLAESTVIFLAALLFWYGAKLASLGEVPSETVIRTFTMLLMSLSVASAILNYIPHISSAREHASRLMRLAKLPEESHEHKGTTRVPATGDIRLHNLTFSYPSRPDVTVLDNVSMSIPAGACVAIVGHSGSGKSTIASLLLKLYGTTEPIGNPNGAMITLSGRDLRHIHTPTVRSLITIVPQTPTLFPGTIAQNIKYGLEPSDPNGSHYNIQAAAHAAGIGDFIEGLEKGYDTVIGEDGTGLSGGQAQRVAIARALVRKPNVLILDEATSALDEQSARLVRESIMSLVNGRRSGGEPNMRALTVIIITHARNMMEMADEVVMLEKGKVVEVGRFQDLASRPWGRFQKLLRIGSQDGEGREIGADGSVMNKGKGRAR